MLRAILAKLKGTPPDPTADWPQLSFLPPVIDRSTGAVGELRFGDDLTSARKFGRPELCRWTQPGYCELIYARQGFQLDFDSGRFAYAAFFVGPDPYLPDSPAPSFSSPRMDSTVLSRASSLPQIEAIFGPADSRDRDDDETVLFYSRADITIEFEFTPTGLLKRVNVYPTQTA